MTETVTIPKSALSLLTTDGYCRRFYVVLIEKGCSHAEAWEQVEAEYVGAFEQHRYTSFDSFKETRRRWVRSFTPPPTPGEK